MSDAPTLTDAVAVIEERRDRKEMAENIDQKVATARGTASSLNGNVSDLADAVRELQFYHQIVTEMFGADIPRNVLSAIDEAESAVEADQDAVINGLVENPDGEPGTVINDLRKDVTGAKSSVEDAQESLKRILQTQASEWEERLSSARELQQIIGEQNDEFARTVSWLENLIRNKAHNPANSASSVVSEWENATDQWEDHQDLQGLDAFQQTHGLSDDAIDAVERLSSSSDLTLADVDIDVLRELKEIDQLAKAVDLSI